VRIRIQKNIFLKGQSYGNRKICIVCGKARDYSCADGAAEVLHLAVDGYGWRENSKRHDLLFQIHPNAFGSTPSEGESQFQVNEVF